MLFDAGHPLTARLQGHGLQPLKPYLDLIQIMRKLSSQFPQYSLSLQMTSHCSQLLLRNGI